MRRTSDRAAACPAVPRTQLGPGVGGSRPLRSSKRELSFVAPAVTMSRTSTACWGVAPHLRSINPAEAVLRVPESLCRDDADLGFAVGDETAHARELGLNGDAQVAVGRVPSEDRVRHFPPTCQPPTQAADRAGLMLDGRHDAGTTRRGRTDRPPFTGDACCGRRSSPGVRRPPGSAARLGPRGAHSDEPLPPDQRRSTR